MVAVRVEEDDVPDPFFAALMAGVDVLEVADLLDPPAWMKDALCKERDGIDWFPDRGHPTEPAKAVCAQCLVRVECLTFALEHHAQGIWGGTSEKTRKQLLNGRVSVADVFAALDARTWIGGVRSTPPIKEPEPEMRPIGLIPEPGVERFPCHSCEQLFAIDELVLGHWCRECW